MNQDSYPNQLFVSLSQRDHYQGMLNAPVILVEYGNYQCPQCREVRQLVQAIQQHFNSGFSEENWVCGVFRHFVQNSIYPQAQKAAQAAAGAQGQFWQMHNMLFIHSQELGDGYLVEYADILGLDVSQFLQDLSNQVHVDRINQDMKRGLNSGVTSTPSLFISGIRYRDRWNMEQLMAAITAANH
ncbi:DsbA family protein [Trichocoleus desertorum AS-A10]|uniref:DsbA family protein n=1 Tax=Trichocoleus desertorum TaxID=1481672 RepID=UPI00329749CF